MLATVRSKLLLLTVVSLLGVTAAATVSYLLAAREVRTIMVNDVSSVAEALEKTVSYVAMIKPDAMQDKRFTDLFVGVKIGQSGYPFMLDEKGTLVVHPTDPGKNLAGKSHIDFIRARPEGGVHEYVATTTGQDKMVAFRFIKPWKVWVVPGVNKDDYFTKLRNNFLMGSALTGGLTLLVLLLVSAWIFRSIMSSLERAMESAERVAGGDLSLRLMVTDSGEGGRLLGAIKRMGDSLARLVGRLEKTAGGIASASTTLDQMVTEAHEAAHAQASRIGDAATCAAEIAASTREIASGMTGLTRSAADTCTSVVEMAESIGAANRTAEALNTAVEEIAGSINQMAVAVRAMGGNSQGLLKTSERVGVSVHEMDATIKRVETATDETVRISSQVRQDAEAGRLAMNAALTGMGEIRESSRFTFSVITGLSQRAEAIGAITSVIDDVARKTNLLALNAAIIASQAGESGKSFAVVAEEINTLAQRTTASTAEITALIQGVQEEARHAVAAIHRAEERINTGKNLSRTSGEALAKIVTGVRDAASRVQEIAHMVRTLSQGSHTVNQSMQSVTRMLDQVSGTMLAQAETGETVQAGAHQIRALTSQLKAAMANQSRTSTLIVHSTELVTSMARRFEGASEEQRNSTHMISDLLDSVRETSTLSLAMASKLQETAAKLTDEVQSLRQDLGIFRLGNG